MLPERLKQYRTARGLTRREMARALGTTARTIVSYELGQRTPPIKKLLAISVLLECSIDDLTAEEASLPASVTLKGGERMSEQTARPYPVTIVGRLSIEYSDGVTSGAGEYAIPAGFLQEVIALVAELQEKYPQLT